MFTLTNTPLNPAQIVKKGWDLYRKSFAQSIPYIIMTGLLVFASGVIGSLLLSDHDALPFLLFEVFHGLLWLVLMAALSFRLYSSCYQISNDFSSTFKQALRKLPSLIGLSLLYCIIVLSCTMLLIVPGIIVAISLMPALTLIIIENQSVLNTLQKSHLLVWGKWWHSAGVIGILFLLVIVCMLAIFTVFGGLSIYQGWEFGNEAPSITVLVFHFLNALLEAFLLPLSLSTMLVLIHDLRIRKGNLSA